MTINSIVEIIAQHTREILPGLTEHVFQPSDSLRDLGANSIDRSEIIVMTLETLSLNIPLVELAGASNIGELASLLHAKR